MARHLSLPVASGLKRAWRVTDLGKSVSLEPEPPRPSKKGGGIKSRKTKWHGDGNPLKCPECESIRLRVVDSRDHRGTRRRRRECTNKHRFWTVEILSNYRGDIGDIAHPEDY